MDFGALIIVLAVMVTASSGAIFKPGAWYEGLNKPKLTPPDWVFPVVWTVLYVMIGIAGWLVWRAQGISILMVLWIIQMVLNGSWSGVFFGMRRMDLAFIVVLVLWLVIAGFISVALSGVTWAAILFVPYLVWVTLAALLNLAVWRMNPEA